MDAREYAPGIPSKAVSHELPHVTEPQVWEFGVHDHRADRRGRHFDLRLGDPSTGHAHSWAMHAEWPKPGERTWAIQQPTHTISYMDFTGHIPEGYGKGKVDLHDRAKTEIMRASPGHVSFNIYRGSGPEEYTLHRVTDKNWILYNRTLSQSKIGLPEGKPKYKEVDYDKTPIHDDKYLMSAKIDDAHNLFLFPTVSGERIRVVSYRQGKKAPGGIIEHTHKVPSLKDGVPTPKSLTGTVLRGGLYALHPETGHAIAPETLAGMLNSDVWKSREKQKEQGELRPVIYDVVQFKGKNMEDAPYEEKLEVLKKVQQELPMFSMPTMAYGEESKRKLMQDIKAGRHPETREGVVLWNLHEKEAPIKAKLVKEHDVYIKGFFPGMGKYEGKGVGGFYYSHEPDGAIVGKVGTGLSDEQRSDMHKHHEIYEGMVARIRATHKYPSGTLKQPSFRGFHLDKNEQARLDMVKQASLPEVVVVWGCASL